MGAGRNKDAIRALQCSLQIHPRNTESLSMLGLLYVLEGQGAEVGLSLCNRAVEMDETEAGFYFRLASALFHLDRFDEALKAVRSAIKLKRNHDLAVLLRGRIYENLGSIRQAKQSYHRVVAMKSAGNSPKKQARFRLKKISAT